MTVWIEKAKRGRGRGRVATPSRVEALSKQMARAITVDFTKGIETFKTRVDPEDLLAAFKSGNYDAVRKLVPWDKMAKDIDPAMQRLAEPMATGAKQAKGALPDPSLKYSLNNRAVQQYIRTRTGELITTSEKGMLQAVRAATTKSFTAAATPQHVADMIRGSIGLNAPQAQALANYRQALATAKAPPNPKRVDTLVSAYRERLLDQRATMIGRTEVRFAQNAGQRAIWDAAEEQGLLPPDTGRRWVVDGNPCKQICLPMNGTVVGLQDPYVLPDGREVMNPTESHPNCYCIEQLVFGEA